MSFLLPGLRSLRSLRLIGTEDDREGIVLDVEAKSFNMVNGTALFLLNLVQRSGGEATFSELEGRLVQEYDVAGDRAERDIANFCARLNNQSLSSTACDLSSSVCRARQDAVDGVPDSPIRCRRLCPM